MYLIALTRWGPPGLSPPRPTPELLAAEVSALTPLLGMGVYELRLALSGPLPLVLLETEDADRARSLLASLRGRGHGAVACDDASVTSSADMLRPKSFVFEPGVITFETPGAAPMRVNPEEVLGLVVATHAREEDSDREVREKKLSLGRAAMTGGLVRSKTKTVTERASTRESERVLYLLNRSGSGHVLLRETRLHYSGLGARKGHSAIESFSTLIAALREHAPLAFHDERLLRQRAGGSIQVSRTSTSRTVTTSNEREVDVAVHLLAVAFLQAQI